jgi:DNA ligase 1
MRRFAELYDALDGTTGTNAKVEALSRYFATAPAADAAWAVHFLTGRRPRRLAASGKLRAWAADAAGIEPWLFEECYHAVGDLAETIALLLPGGTGADDLPLNRWIEERLLPLQHEDEAGRRAGIESAWRELSGTELFVWNKLITGGFRVGVSQSLVVRALARVSGVEPSAVAHRLMGAWDPSPDFYTALFRSDTRDADISRPYPFFLAHPLESEPASLGVVGEWQAEWKWDGIRAQLIRRDGQTFLWSRGEELITERFPELADAAAMLPDGTVLDGEILPWEDEAPMPFAQLQRRIGRKVLGPKILREVPVALLCYDLLEHGGVDIRAMPMIERREMLERLFAGTTSAGRFRISPLIRADRWSALAEARAASRERGAEGLMLKRAASAYGVGRRRGDWWKWKVEPLTADAVLVYAQRGSGRRASLYTDYTFAVWNEEGELVPFAKAYSGLTDAEIRRVDAFVRRNTRDRFGPVRTVTPELVFEIAFEGIQLSTRHKSGIAVRFPRILRWRTDKKPEDADTLATIRALLIDPEPGSGA